VVERNSKDFWHFDDEWLSTRKVLENIYAFKEHKKDYVIGNDPKFIIMPHRWLLPKGTPDGMTFQLFVMVTPYHGPPADEGLDFPLIDNFGYGYPFDRPILDESYHRTNMHFKDVQIFHKTESMLNRA
jgi:hypothetical protein